MFPNISKCITESWWLCSFLPGPVGNIMGSTHARAVRASSNGRSDSFTQSCIENVNVKAWLARCGRSWPMPVARTRCAWLTRGRGTGNTVISRILVVSGHHHCPFRSSENKAQNVQSFDISSNWQEHSPRQNLFSERKNLFLEQKLLLNQVSHCHLHCHRHHLPDHYGHQHHHPGASIAGTASVSSVEWRERPSRRRGRGGAGDDFYDF